VIVEYIRYRVPADRAAEFEEAYRAGAVELEASSHCLRHEVARGVEEPENHVVRIEWDSMEGHLDGFRRSEGFTAFLAAVKPFFEEIEEMKHPAVTASSPG
jgi:quinol monooxygenase YgiN